MIEEKFINPWFSMMSYIIYNLILGSQFLTISVKVILTLYISLPSQSFLSLGLYINFN